MIFKVKSSFFIAVYNYEKINIPCIAGMFYSYLCKNYKDVCGNIVEKIINFGDGDQDRCTTEYIGHHSFRKIRLSPIFTPSK